MKHLIKSTIVLLFVLCLVGCETPQRRLTKDQWLQEMPPPDTIEKAEAMAILQTKITETKAKMEAKAGMEKLKIYCVIGFIASLAIIALKQRLIGGVGLVASLGGFVLAYAGTEYGRYLGIVGLVVAVAGGCYAIYFIVDTLKKVIKGNKEFKEKASPEFVELLRCAQRKMQGGTKDKPSATEKVVERIRKAL